MTNNKTTSSVKSNNKSAHKLGFFGFFAITASMVMTVYEYPSFASSGFQLVFFLIVGGLFGSCLLHYALQKWQQ